MHNIFRRRPSSTRAGFTIIEVLIVLAVAALILVVVILAVPALQRNSRNYDRKRFVEAVGAQLQQYYTDNHAYPQTAAEGTIFVNSYANDVKGFNNYTVQFWDISHDHGYMPSLDRVAVQFGHWCNRYGDGDAATDAIAGTDTDTHAFVVWTQLEPVSSPAKVVCVDNHR